MTSKRQVGGGVGEDEQLRENKLEGDKREMNDFEKSSWRGVGER